MILDGVNGDIRTDFRDGGFVVRVSSVDRRFGSCNERLRKFPFLYLSFEIHTIRQVKYLSKHTILTSFYFKTIFLVKSKLSKLKTPTFSRVFHQNFFWRFFSWNQSCQQLKSAKPQHFREFFIKLNIWTKNKDFDYNSVSIVIAFDILTGVTRLCCR